MNLNYVNSLPRKKMAFMYEGVWKYGLIVDKFKDIITTSTYIGYGNGNNSSRDNVVSKQNPIVVDFYLIEVYPTDTLYSVRCGCVQIYDVKKHSNSGEKTEESIKRNIEESLG